MQQVLNSGIDPTGYTSISGSELKQLVDEAQPVDGIGFNITTEDVAGNPVVPDPTDTGMEKLESFIWRRVTADTVVLYSWNPNAATDVTYLKWQSATQLSIAPNSIVTSMIRNAAVTDEKIASISASKVTGLASAFPPSGAASGDLAGTYPAPTVAANAITSTKLSSSATDDNLRAVGNDHVKTQSLTIIGLAGKISIAGVTALQMLRMNAAATAWEAFYNYFAQLSTIGTAFQVPRVNAGATALEWVDATVIQRVVKTLAATTGTGAIPFDSTAPLYNEGDHVVSQAFTPKLTTSQVRVRFSCFVSDGAAANVIAALFNSTGATDPAVNVCVAQIVAANSCHTIQFEYIYAPASVSAITFTVNVGTTSGTYSIGKASGNTMGGIGLSYLTIEEINGTLS